MGTHVTLYSFSTHLLLLTLWSPHFGNLYHLLRMGLGHAKLDLTHMKMQL